MVKILLRPGEAITLHSYETTDEGWSSWTDVLTHCGDRIRSETVSAGRDCDGRLDHYGEYECKLDKLAAFESPTSPGYFLPTWDKVETSQYDEHAEMAGY